LSAGAVTPIVTALLVITVRLALATPLHADFLITSAGTAIAVTAIVSARLPFTVGLAGAHAIDTHTVIARSRVGCVDTAVSRVAGIVRAGVVVIAIQSDTENALPFRAVGVRVAGGVLVARVGVVVGPLGFVGSGHAFFAGAIGVGLSILVADPVDEAEPGLQLVHALPLRVAGIQGAVTLVIARDGLTVALALPTAFVILGARVLVVALLANGTTCLHRRT